MVREGLDSLTVVWINFGQMGWYYKRIWQLPDVGCEVCRFGRWHIHDQPCQLSNEELLLKGFLLVDVLPFDGLL